MKRFIYRPRLDDRATQKAFLDENQELSGARASMCVYDAVAGYAEPACARGWPGKALSGRRLPRLASQKSHLNLTC